MFRYELKKIFHKRVNLLVMLAGYVILMVTTIYPVMSESEYIYSKDMELTGTEAVSYNREFVGNKTDKLTEEFLNATMDDLNKSNVNPLSDEGYLTLDEK